MGIFSKDLFPTKWSLFIFIAYMSLFVSQGTVSWQSPVKGLLRSMNIWSFPGLLVTASRNGLKTYPYNPTTLVLLTEISKLLLSSSVYIKEWDEKSLSRLWKALPTLISRNSVISLIREVYRHSIVLAYYMIPAFLYCLYNNLSFVNLTFFDPTTYFMFMQIRMLMTGVIYQVKRNTQKIITNHVTFFASAKALGLEEPLAGRAGGADVITFEFLVLPMWFQLINAKQIWRKVRGGE